MRHMTYSAMSAIISYTILLIFRLVPKTGIVTKCNGIIILTSSPNVDLYFNTASLQCLPVEYNRKSSDLQKKDGFSMIYFLKM